MWQYYAVYVLACVVAGKFGQVVATLTPTKLNFRDPYWWAEMLITYVFGFALAFGLWTVIGAFGWHA